MAPFTRAQRKKSREAVSAYMKEQEIQRRAAAEMQEAATALLNLAKREKTKAEKNLRIAKVARDKILRKALPVRQTRSMAKR